MRKETEVLCVYIFKKFKLGQSRVHGCLESPLVVTIKKKINSIKKVTQT